MLKNLNLFIGFPIFPFLNRNLNETKIAIVHKDSYNLDSSSEGFLEAFLTLNITF